MEFMNCPHYEEDPSKRCALPAEVTSHYRMLSTDGFVDAVRITCVMGHMFNGPVEAMKF